MFWLGNPSFRIRKEKVGFEENNVKNGDLLTLKNNKNFIVDEMIVLKVYVTLTGLPDDCEIVGDINVSKEYLLNDLKEELMMMKYFCERKVVVEQIRIRERLQNMFFG